MRIRTVVSTAPGETVERGITQTVTTPAAVEEEDDVASPPPSPTPVSPTPPAGADGHSLNDRGYALQQQGRYAEALPLLQQAVPALRGTYTPQDRYEAYANYNLGYTLLQLGRCDEALPYLNRSEQLQGHRTEIDAARAAAEECATRGGRGRGNPNED